MYRFLFPLSLLLAAALSAASLSAAELSLSLGIRQASFPGDFGGDGFINGDDESEVLLQIGETGSLSADLDGDFDVDFDDLTLIQDRQGTRLLPNHYTSLIGTDGYAEFFVIEGDWNWNVSSAPVANTGNQTLNADGTWQQITFELPLDLFYPASHLGILENIRFTDTADGETRYKVWIDDIASTWTFHSWEVLDSAAIFGDFEGNAPGDEVIFQEPGFASGGDLLITPDVTEVTDSAAFSGNHSLTTEFEFVDDSSSRSAVLSTFGTDNMPNPLILLQEFNIEIDGPPSTTLTFWAKAEAVVVPEPSSAVLMLISLCSILTWRR